MTKKLITPMNIFVFLWGIVLLVISKFYNEYTRYYLYTAILVMISIVIINLIKQRKEDKKDGTEHFKISLFNILIATVIMAVLFFLIK